MQEYGRHIFGAAAVLGTPRHPPSNDWEPGLFERGRLAGPLAASIPENEAAADRYAFLIACVSFAVNLRRGDSGIVSKECDKTERLQARMSPAPAPLFACHLPS